MSTHPIGPGTCNLSVNVRKSIRLALGRVACALDLSTSELVRRLLRLGARVWHSAIRADRAAALDLQALAQLRHARQPASPGGTTVTDAEFASVESLIQQSAHLDGRIASALDLRRSA
jgi:hypothetical protein